MSGKFKAMVAALMCVMVAWWATVVYVGYKALTHFGIL